MEPQSQPKTPQAPSAPRTDYDKELSVGTYAGKKVYETVVGLGTSALGAWAGVAAASKWMKGGVSPEAAKAAVEAGEKGVEVAHKLPGNWGKIPGLKGALTQRQFMWGGIGGLFAGSLVGGLFLGYEHWQKVKREQLQVDEITKDISDIEVFKKTDPELAAENKRLWGELEKREAEKPANTVSHVQHASAHVGKPHAEHASKEQHGEKSHADHHAKKDDRGDSWKEAVHASKEHAEHHEAVR